MAGSGLTARLCVAAASAGAFALGGCVASPNSAPADNSVVEATTSATPAGKPPAAAKPPRVLLDVRGNGSKNTPPFATTRPWKLTYDYDCSASYGGKGNFIVSVYDGTGLVDAGVNELGKGGKSESSVYTVGAQLHLEVISECPWHIRVIG